MSEPDKPSRRAILRQVAFGLSAGALGFARVPVGNSANEPLLSEQDPAAKKVHYVEDASHAHEAQPGADCSNCSIYAAVGATQGSCTLFKGKLVKAAGWCTAWSGL
jgi:hypothetical protein